VGPHLMQSLLGVLTLTKRIYFDMGVVPPGSYSSVRYLLTGDPALTSRSLWPWSKDPQGTHHYIEKLGQMEGCDWQEMQGALCCWAPWRRFPQQGPVHTDRREQTKDLSDGLGLAVEP
jgi:hypothetical protein